ncbi:MAG: hypothetical protein ACK6AD_11520, partial [Cyanobacteriota bacterium]
RKRRINLIPRIGAGRKNLGVNFRNHVANDAFQSPNPKRGIAIMEYDSFGAESSATSGHLF